MNENDVLKVFKNEKALLSGHFLLSSGLHSPNYMQCALVLQNPKVAEKLCRELVKELKKAKIKIDVVIGPALGGMIVSYEMGRALGVRSIFAERVEGRFALRRGFRLKSGEKVLVVEDVITTGKSSYETIELVKREGGRIAAVASIVDRSGGVAIFQEEFLSLVKISIKSYRPEECPLCRERKIPLTKPGSRGLKVSA
jgi:orotate phosphoribosyltransferase